MLFISVWCDKGGWFIFFEEVPKRCVRLKVKAQQKQEVNVSLTLPRQAHKKEVEDGLVGKSRDIWAAASLPSKDSYCGSCFCFR